jgi:hypothetical protein
MAANMFRHVYGPVPSRRLGRSLGVDLVPFKTCTYDCMYCQLGHTTDQTTRRTRYADTERVLAEVKAKLESAPLPNYVSLAGSGEPTLHAGIGELNTVSRPPAEECARAVPAEQLSRLAPCFGGSVEIIGDAGASGSAGPWDDTVSDTSILDLLSRRPCTADGVAAGLGLHIQVAAKRLDALEKTGAITVRQKEGQIFYCLRQHVTGVADRQ